MKYDTIFAFKKLIIIEEFRYIKNSDNIYIVNIWRGTRESRYKKLIELWNC